MSITAFCPLGLTYAIPYDTTRFVQVSIREVLITLGAILREMTRQADYVFRWGGDEFLVLITCGAEEARRAMGLPDLGPVHERYVSMMVDAINKQGSPEAFQQMLAHAGEIGANAVVGVRYDATEIMQGVTEVLCYGTAVVVEKE
mgnify:CR=1 FL=1